MARKPRIHYPGAFYHVILRGNGGQDIFFSKWNLPHVSVSYGDLQYFYIYCYDIKSHINKETPLKKINQII